MNLERLEEGNERFGKKEEISLLDIHSRTVIVADTEVNAV